MNCTEQYELCSCLTLILACVIYWQARDFAGVRACQPEDDKLDITLLEHVSPIEWDNVICTGSTYWTAPSPLTGVLRGYFCSNLGGTLIGDGPGRSPARGVHREPANHVFIKPGCPNAASISPGNRIPFNSAGAAEAAGFRPGKDCLNR